MNSFTFPICDGYSFTITTTLENGVETRRLDVVNEPGFPAMPAPHEIGKMSVIGGGVDGTITWTWHGPGDSRLEIGYDYTGAYGGYRGVCVNLTGQDGDEDSGFWGDAELEEQPDHLTEISGESANFAVFVAQLPPDNHH